MRQDEVNRMKEMATALREATRFFDDQYDGIDTDPVGQEPGSVSLAF